MYNLIIWHDGSFMSLSSGPDDNGRGQQAQQSQQQHNMIYPMSSSTTEARITPQQNFLEETQNQGIDDCDKEDIKKEK
jgi:hypothetical protein